MALTLVAGCSTDDSNGATRAADAAAADGGAAEGDAGSETAGTQTGGSNAPTVAAVGAENEYGYRFERLGMTAGGWVTGLVIHPTSPGVMYARTDVGGAYRWDAGTQRWIQMIDADSVAEADRDGSDYVVESIAVAASDPDFVAVVVGNDDLSPQNISAGGTGRLMVSTDAGRSWTSGRDRFHVAGNADFRQLGERLAFDPADRSRLFFASRLDGLLRSDNAGMDLDRVAAGQIPVGRRTSTFGAPAGVSFVIADPDQMSATGDRTERWYAGVAGEGVYRSDDAGSNWRRVLDVDEATVPRDPQVVDGRLWVAFNDTDGEDGSIRHYDPDADAWTRLDLADKAVRSVAVDPTDPDRVLLSDAAIRYGEVRLSEDGGRTFSTPQVTTSAPSAPWIEQSNEGSYMPIGEIAFDPHDPGRIWFAEGIGVWTAIADEDSLDWRFAGDGIEELVVSTIVSPPGGSAVSAVADFQGFLHETPGAVPRRPLVDGRFAGGTDIDWSGGNPSNLVWIGAEYNRYFDDDREARAAISRDGGSTWSELPNLQQDMFGGTVAVAADDPDNIVWLPSYYLSPFEHIDQPRGLYVTTDGGEDWTQLDDVGGSNSFHRLMWWFGRHPLAADRVAPSTFYLMDEDGTMYVSTNGGLEWSPSRFGPPCSEQNDCHVDGRLEADPHRARVLWAGVGTDGLFRSDDAGGSEWRRLDAVDEVRSFGFGAPMGDAPSSIFLQGRANDDAQDGIYRSDDDGVSFTRIGSLPLAVYRDIAVVTGDMSVPGRVYVGFSGVGAVYGEPVQ